MKKYQRSGILFLILVLVTVWLVNDNSVVRKSGAASAKAENGGDSGLVMSSDLNEIFDTGGFTGTVNGQSIFMADSSGGINSPFYAGQVGVGHYQWKNNLMSRKAISLKADWSFVSNYTMIQGSCDVETSGGWGVHSADTSGGAGTTGVFGVSMGKSIVQIPNMTPPASGIWTASNGANDLRGIDVPVDLTKTNVYSLKYKSQNKEFFASVGNGTLKIENTTFPNAAKAKISMSCLIKNTTEILSQKASVNAEFVTAGYDHYTPEFTSTELIKADGTPLTPAEISELSNGGTIYVRCTVVNSNADARADEIVYSHVKISEDEKYPTSSSIEFLPNTVRMGSIPSSGTLVSGASMEEGIPVEVSTAPTVFTYQIKVNADDGKAVNLGQVLTDDFFQSKRYSAAKLVPAQQLIPEDDDAEEGEPGKDYHYTRTEPNENGWNNSDVVVKFFPGSYNEFNIADPANDSIFETLKEGGKDSKVYSEQTDRSGEAVYYQAANTTDNLVSVKKQDCIKIDKEASVITVDSENKKLTLQDSLSGVWKLYKLDEEGTTELNGKKYKEVMVNELTDGNGPSSSEYLNVTNGKYLAMDAAGNVSGLIQVTVTAPPSVTPNDPDLGGGKEETKTNPDGTRKRTLTDRITKIISDPPESDGILTKDELMQWIAGSYHITSNAADPTLNISFSMKQEGKDISAQGFRTDTPGVCEISYQVTDAEGNITELLLTYKFIRKMEPPKVDVIVPEGGGRPSNLTPEIEEDEEGLQHAVIKDILRLKISSPPSYGGRMSAADAAEFFKNRYKVKSPIDEEGNLTYSPVTIEKLTGSAYTDISSLGMDTSIAGTYRLTQLVTDSYGNTTLIELIYILEEPDKEAGGDKTQGGNGTQVGNGTGNSNGEGTWSGGETDITRAAIQENQRLNVKGANDRPKTMDGLIDPDCLLHRLMLFGILLTLCYTLVKGTYKKEHKEAAKHRHSLDEYLVFGLALVCTSCGIIFRSCALELVMAALWTAVVIGSMTLLASYSASSASPHGQSCGTR